LKKIARFVKEQNEKIYAPLGLLLTDPIERGLRVVSITVLVAHTNRVHPKLHWSGQK
jgi:hypothetical protein